MYRSILIAYDGEAGSRSALLECIRLDPPSSTRIHLLAVSFASDQFVIGEYGATAAYASEKYVEEERSRLQNITAQGCKLLQDAGLRAETYVEFGEPADVISRLAAQLDVDLVIVGHPRHKSWLERWWRGSTDAVLLEKLRCTLMVAADFPAAA